MAQVRLERGSEVGDSGFPIRADLLQADPHLPLYVRLQQIIRGTVVGGAAQRGRGIPAERDLAAGYGVSRITVRKAIEGLVEEGLLSRRRGAGTFVAGRVDKVFAKLSSFSEDMQARGRVPGSRWLSRATGPVTPDEAMALGLSPGSTVLRFQRVRLADDEPMALEYTTLLADALGSVDVVSGSLYDALDVTGFRPVRALQRLRAVPLAAQHARLLGVETHHPMLLIERRGFLADGRAVEFTRSYYRGDAYDFVAEL